MSSSSGPGFIPGALVCCAAAALGLTVYWQLQSLSQVRLVLIKILSRPL